MKKNIITAGIIAVIAIVAFLNVNVASKSEKSNSLVDISLTSVEALAGEAGSVDHGRPLMKNKNTGAYKCSNCLGSDCGAAC
jgi:hypothetical protein